jgi:hypothetical protein
MVAAGSVVSCDSVLSGAEACGVAIRLAGTHAVRILSRNRRRQLRLAVHHVLEVVIT